MKIEQRLTKVENKLEDINKTLEGLEKKLDKIINNHLVHLVNLIKKMNSKRA